MKSISAAATQTAPITAPAPAAVAPAATAPVAAAPVSATPANAPTMAKDAPLAMKKFYFETGKADLAGDAAKDVDAIVAAAKGSASAKVVISGFHDASGNPDQNQALAKERAFKVRDAIKAAGIADDRFELKKPELTTGSGEPKEARRVEVRVMM